MIDNIVLLLISESLRTKNDCLLRVWRHRVERYDRFEVAPNYRDGNHAVILESRKISPFMKSSLASLSVGYY